MKSSAGRMTICAASMDRLNSCFGVHCRRRGAADRVRRSRPRTSRDRAEKLTVFEVGLERRTDARRRAKRRAPVVHRKARHVKSHTAGLRLSLDHDEHGTSVSAGAEGDPAAARKVRTGRTHLGRLRRPGLVSVRRFAGGHVSAPLERGRQPRSSPSPATRARISMPGPGASSGHSRQA